MPPIAKLLSIFTKKIKPKGSLRPLSISTYKMSPTIKSIAQQLYETINCQRYRYNVNNELSGVAQQHVFEYIKQEKQSGFQYCKMEGINNATRCQIVINFYQNNQAKGKLYTTEYFSKLNVTYHQVYRATTL